MVRKLQKISLTILFAAVSVFLLCYAYANLDKRPIEEDFKSEEKENTPDIGIENTDTENEVVSKKDVWPTPHDFLSKLPDADSKNRAVTDAVYEENFTIARWYIPDRSILPDDAKYSIDIDMGTGSSVTQTYFTMWPRMGFILMADGKNREILAPNGAVINVQDDHYLAFASARTSSGTPVFFDCNTGKYVTLLTDGKISECDYDKKRDFRGIVFDYPSYFGQADTYDCNISFDGKRFGYEIIGEDAKNVPNSYEMAHNYSEGFGCCYDKDNRVYFFNELGRLRIGGLMVNADMYGSGEINDERALGYYYFDEGLTRVTIKKYQKGKLAENYHTFINRKGEEFKTPEDYTVYSYSCGRILLEKDGKFGYMTSRGKWLCDPEYTYARPFFEGLAVVGEKDGKKGMIDRNGEYVIPPIFDEICDCSGGVITVYDSEMGWQVLNKQIEIPEF